MLKTMMLASLALGITSSWFAIPKGDATAPKAAEPVATCCQKIAKACCQNGCENCPGCADGNCSACCGAGCCEKPEAPVVATCDGCNTCADDCATCCGDACSACCQEKA